MKKTEWFAMRLDPQTQENLERFAEKTGLSQSAAVRLLINHTSDLNILIASQPAQQQAQLVGND